MQKVEHQGALHAARAEPGPRCNGELVQLLRRPVAVVIAPPGDLERQPFGLQLHFACRVASDHAPAVPAHACRLTV